MTSDFPDDGPYAGIRSAAERSGGSIMAFASLLPELPKVEARCHYCHHKFMAYVGMPTDPNAIVEQQMRTGVTEPIAHCGGPDCSRKDYLRQDTMFLLIQREKARHAEATRPGSVGANSVQGEGKKTRVSKGNPPGGVQLAGILEPVADAEGHPPERLPDNPF